MLNTRNRSCFLRGKRSHTFHCVNRRVLTRTARFTART